MWTLYFIRNFFLFTNLPVACTDSYLIDFPVQFSFTAGEYSLDILLQSSSTLGRNHSALEKVIWHNYKYRGGFIDM